MVVTVGRKNEKGQEKPVQIIQQNLEVAENHSGISDKNSFT